MNKLSNNKIIDKEFKVMSEDAPMPPPALLTRILEDALAQQAAFPAMHAPMRGAALWRDLLRALGGWPAMAGLALATVAGLAIGAFPPDILPETTSAYLGLTDGGYLIDIAPGEGFDLAGGAL